ncbi:hypothetical protein VTL71DRAFT_12501 [Oculimacula yallundae]|uniref:2EXR domain-containing protein n=1 Tax=Oculimacula yallundae TaxID=86028 RepID=A0ABR4CPY4_9HELO
MSQTTDGATDESLFDWTGLLNDHSFDSSAQTSRSSSKTLSGDGATNLLSGSTVNGASQASTEFDVTLNLTSFTLFPKLPPELRLMVWEYVCFFTRNVPLWNVLLAKPRQEDIGYIPYKYITGCPPPSILSVNLESRETGFKYYKLSLGGVFLLEKGVTVKAEARKYVHFLADRICPLKEFCNTMDNDDEDAFKKYWLSRVAVNTNTCWRDHDETSPFWVEFDMLQYPEWWFHSDMREILIYDEDFSEREPYPLEFEEEKEAELATMEIEVQVRILEFKKSLNAYINGEFEVEKDLEVVRKRKIAKCEAEGKTVPDHLLRKQSWVEPTIKVVRVKRN